MGALRIAAWLVLALIGIFLVYVAIVSGVVMVMGIFTGSGELTGAGLAGLFCTVVVIVAPAMSFLSRRKKRQAAENEGVQI